MTDPAIAVKMTGISKHFGGVRALDEVDLVVREGEVHALLGGNGAGKSTILKILNGVHKPDSGTVEVGGKTIINHTPEAARAAGVAMNFQELSLIPTLTVAQNVFLTRESRNTMRMIDDKALVGRAQELFDLLEADVDPSAIVDDLGAGRRQLTEIAKAISQNARVLVLDEPSTALAVSDVQRLFGFLRKLKAQGIAIIYVSHRMDEIAQIADRATILRDGKNVITAPIDELPIDTMIEHIVGKRSLGLADVEKVQGEMGEPILELRNITGQFKPENVSLTVHRGEVVGLAGLLGSGRSCIARIIAGIEQPKSGQILIHGVERRFPNPGDSTDAGVALVPEARATQGVIPAHTVSSNMVLAVLDRITKGFLTDRKAINTVTDNQIDRLSIKTASRDHAVSTLSGGNQQKVVIGKWLATQPEIFVLDEPTAGIDIGSKSEIIQLVRDLAAEGKAILMISSELSELLTACDRIAVIADGQMHHVYSHAHFEDHSNKNSDLTHRLQLAEQNLQAAIQEAIIAGTKTNNAHD